MNALERWKVIRGIYEKHRPAVEARVQQMTPADLAVSLRKEGLLPGDRRGLINTLIWQAAHDEIGNFELRANMGAL